MFYEKGINIGGYAVAEKQRLKKAGLTRPAKMNVD